MQHCETIRISCFERVIVPIDPGHIVHRELAPAAALAERAGAEIVLLTVSHPHHPPGVERLQRLDRLADGLGPLPVRTELFTDPHPWAGIVAFARSNPGSIVCMASHGPGRLSENLHTTVSAPVVEHAPCPVVLIGPNCTDQQPAYGELVACVDNSPSAKHVVETFAHWSVALGLTPWLVQAVQRGHHDPKADAVESQSLVGHARRLRELGVKTNWDVVHDVHVNHPYRSLARWGGLTPGSMIMMGSHGHTARQHLVAGSSIMHVAHEAFNPVVVLPAVPPDQR
jgi:nucleotide-binding universal stress UspA family protein